jgi:hypothetical protein
MTQSQKPQKDGPFSRCKSYCEKQVLPTAKRGWSELSKVWSKTGTALEKAKPMAKRGGQKLEEATRKWANPEGAKKLGQRAADEWRECWDKCKSAGRKVSSKFKK